jgi:hypothetical protein
MIEIESMAMQGPISRPGAWSFPDCSELGTAGLFSYTWEESKSILALFAVTSSPIILGNDPRPGRMQPRLVDLYLNPDMLAVNQQYSTAAKHAGGRLWSGPGGQEVRMCLRPLLRSAQAKGWSIASMRVDHRMSVISPVLARSRTLGVGQAIGESSGGCCHRSLQSWGNCDRCRPRRCTTVTCPLFGPALSVGAVPRVLFGRRATVDLAV